MVQFLPVLERRVAWRAVTRSGSAARDEPDRWLDFHRRWGAPVWCVIRFPTIEGALKGLTTLDNSEHANCIATSEPLHERQATGESIPIDHLRDARSMRGRPSIPWRDTMTPS